MTTLYRTCRDNNNRPILYFRRYIYALKKKRKLQRWGSINAIHAINLNGEGSSPTEFDGGGG